jgi:Chaperone of endosialidase
VCLKKQKPTKNSKPKTTWKDKKMKKHPKENPIKPIKTRIGWTQRHSGSILAAVALACFAVSPAALARPSPTPTPSENRGNGNSAAESVDALNLSTTGLNNTAHGWHALSANTEGNDNTANGYHALSNNTTGDFNTAVGESTLTSNTTGSANTAIGSGPLFDNTTGYYNTAVGVDALGFNTDGYRNTAIGVLALADNTAGVSNTAIGVEALSSNTDGYENTAISVGALFSNTNGFENTAIGYEALRSNTSGSGNVAIGSNALVSNEDGAGNVAIGAGALLNNTGGWNMALGETALYSNTTGGWNVALGVSAGSNQTSGSHNIYIGEGTLGVPGENYTCYIGNIYGATSSAGTPVYINAYGKLGTTTSSRRFKEDIKPMNDASEALFALKPVTFRYKKEIDPKGVPQFGLVAEDVEKVNPKLVVRDKDGKVNTVRYDQINSMLLNEFLKEHKRVENQQAAIRQLKSKAADQEVTICELSKGIGILTAQLKEQAAQIQRVSAQLEMSRPVTKVALSTCKR